jgi:hypothetical protein
MSFSLANLFGAKPFDYQAQAQQFMQALQRQNEIQNGMRGIDSAFGQFDDKFYNGRRQAALDYYMPQADQQYNDARKQLTFALARSGGAQSSAAAQQQADLERKMMAARQGIMDKADSSVQGMRNNVEAARADLVNMLNQSGSASTVGDNARARVAALSMPESYSSLADLFSTGASIANQQKGLEDAWNASNGLTARPSNWIFSSNMVKDPSRPTGQPLQLPGAVQYS